MHNVVRLRWSNCDWTVATDKVVATFRTDFAATLLF